VFQTISIFHILFLFPFTLTFTHTHTHTQLFFSFFLFFFNFIFIFHHFCKGKSFPSKLVRETSSNSVNKNDMCSIFFIICETHEFLILFIPILSLPLKKYVHLTCSNYICHFYRLSWNKFFQPNLEENSVLKL
jgi:hypothetical protein